MSDVGQKGFDEVFCASCGSIIKKEAEICMKCGVRQRTESAAANEKWLATLLLCIFFGVIGVHRFYTGKVGTGVLMIITFGGLGIWWLIDLIMIITGTFKNKAGQFITLKQGV